MNLSASNFITIAPAATFIGVLAFLLVLGGIAALGRRRDPVSVAAGAAWYVQSAVAVFGTMMLVGLATLIKVIVGFVNPKLAYPDLSSLYGGFPSGGFSPSVPDIVGNAREMELILALILVAVGALFFWLHYTRLNTSTATADGSLPWIAWGVPIITIVAFAAIGVTSTVLTLNGIVGNIVIDHSNTGPNMFGDGLGLALVFVPAWLYLTMRTFKAAREGVQPPPYVWHVAMVDKAGTAPPMS